MNIGFIISSAIDLGENQNKGFNGIGVRSAFSTQERLMQTQFTLASINLLFPDAKKYIFDVGKNSKKYAEHLSYVKNLEFFSLEELDEKQADLCLTSPSKGLCEATATHLFLQKKKDELKKYDFLIKISGRYYYTAFNKNFLSKNNLDKVLTKKIYKWEWKNSWRFPEFLKHTNDMLFWMPTTTYCIPQKCFENYTKSMQDIKNIYEENEHPDFQRIDFECMMFHFLLKNKNFIETDWMCEGSGGQDKKLNPH